MVYEVCTNHTTIPGLTVRYRDALADIPTDRAHSRPKEGTTAARTGVVIDGALVCVLPLFYWLLE